MEVNITINVSGAADTSAGGVDASRTSDARPVVIDKDIDQSTKKKFVEMKGPLLAVFLAMAFRREKAESPNNDKAGAQRLFEEFSTTRPFFEFLDETGKSVNVFDEHWLNIVQEFEKTHEAELTTCAKLFQNWINLVAANGGWGKDCRATYGQVTRIAGFDWASRVAAKEWPS